MATLGYEDELRTLLQTLNGNMSRLGGNVGRSGNAKLGPIARQFNDAVSSMTKGVKLLHGTTDDLSYSIKHMLEYVAGGEIIKFMIDAGRNLTSNFTKMADVGQMFQGSMFDMAAKAGQAGLSLDEYTKMITRNSTAAVILASEQGMLTKDLGGLQKEVRNTTKAHGFYGMTLSQVTDTTSDTVESLRQAGVLDRLDEEGRRKAVVQMISDATGFSAATGKSREEIIKMTQAATRNTSAAFRLAFLPIEAQKNFETFSAGLAALPGQAGEQLSQAFAENFGRGGSAWTDMGTVFREAGLQNINEMMDAIGRKIASGQQISPEETMEFTQRFNQAVDGAGKTLLEFQKDAKLRPGVDQIMALRNLTRFDPQAAIKRMHENVNKPFDVMTTAATTFESNFHSIIGQFQQGFYGTLMSAFLPKGEKDPAKIQESLDKTISDLTKAAGALGTALGGLAMGVAKVVEWWLDMWQKMGVGGGWAALISLGLLKISKTFAHWFFQRAVIRAGVAQLMTGRGGGPPAPPGAAPIPGSAEEFDEHIKGTGKATMSQGIRRYGALTGSIGGTLIGIAASIALDRVMDSVMGSEDSITKSVMEAGLDVAATAGLTAVGGMLGRSIAKMIAVRMAGAVAAEAVGGGLEVAAGGALAAVAWPVAVVGAAVAAITYAFYKNRQNNEDMYNTAKTLGLKKKGGDGWFDRIPTFDDPTDGHNLDYTTTQERVNLFKENTQDKDQDQLADKLKELTDEKEADRKKLDDEKASGKEDTDLQKKIAMLLMEIRDIGVAQASLQKKGNDTVQNYADKKSFADVNCGR